MPIQGIVLIRQPRKRNNIRERRAKQAEKIRLEEVKAKMSAKKAQRMKKVRQPVLAPYHDPLTTLSAWEGPRRSMDDQLGGVWVSEHVWRTVCTPPMIDRNARYTYKSTDRQHLRTSTVETLKFIRQSPLKPVALRARLLVGVESRPASAAPYCRWQCSAKVSIYSSP